MRVSEASLSRVSSCRLALSRLSSTARWALSRVMPSRSSRLLRICDRILQGILFGLVLVFRHARLDDGGFQLLQREVGGQVGQLAAGFSP